MSSIQGIAKPNSLLTALAFPRSQRRYGKVLQAHYADRQLVELTFLIAWEQCVERLNRALGIEADEVSGNGYCLVPVAR